MRNEEFYIPVLEAMAASPVLEEIEKVRPKARLELAQKNRIGTKAINFTYTLLPALKAPSISLMPIIFCYLSIIPVATLVRRQSKV